MEVNDVVEKGHAAGGVRVGGVRVGGVDGAFDCAGKEVEASLLVGWTFSDGVDRGNELPIPSGTVNSSIASIEGSFKWGLTSSALTRRTT